MHIPPRSLPGLAAGAVLLLAALSPSAARADASKNGAQVMVFLNDGTVLQGMDRREGHFEYEEDRSFVFMPTGFFFLDDGPRRQYFGTKLMREIKPRPDAPEDKVVGKQRPIAIPSPRPVPAVDEVLSSGPWNDKWDRTVAFRSGLTEMTVNQHLQYLTPYYARTDATDHWLWPAVYLTRELGPDAVRDLLSRHPDYVEDKTLAPAVLTEHRFRYYNFFAQAGWYDEAETELGRLLADRPSDQDRDRALAALASLGRVRCREQFETIKKLHNAGEYKAVRRRLDAFNDKAADDATLTDLHTMRDEYAAIDKSLADAARLLDDLPKQLTGGTYDAALVEAAAALSADLRPEALPRLEAFLGQAQQAERQKAAGLKPSAGPVELLSLAVTGWLLGNPSAEGKPETAARVWRARKFLLAYLPSDNAARGKQLADYLSDRGGPASVDELTQIIPQLPPPEPEEKITDDPVTVKIGGAGKGGTSYLLQLPPEYRHGRNYPVLFVLHQAGEGPDDMLKRWSDAAAENGYILVAPEWVQGAGGVYGFSEREHATVLETLRDLRRRFAVDSDRVFLFGLGQGGAMAFDVGLSHPDLFAGVLPMSAGPDKFSSHYYRNGQYLPFYIVDGDRSDKKINENLRKEFAEWVSQYPMIWIQYKGRGVEWYGAEVPLMFDWMRNKRREFPLQGLGMAKDAQTKAFSTHRPTDNSFYWTTTDGVQPRCFNGESNWESAVEPATLAARIDLDVSTISLGTTGLSQVTVWLGRNGKGESMVDLGKPLTVRWNSNVVWNNKKVEPSLETLLEDLVRRGDRQRLFLAKLEFQGK